MPRDVKELKKYENLSDFKSKIYKIFDENRGKGFNLQEIYQIAYPELVNADFDKKWKDILANLVGTLTLNSTLDTLKKKKGLKTIFSEGTQYYYLE